ncbi:MAG TPA: glycosyltransferase [Bacteroidales bacterium]|nr:MAG: hypothetical protein A2X11_07440 [Bacteroidetes bacterium GWE2_42_24]OFY29509.1 MAG: hypothetical protein A2X09_04160 [Bacteroidetes bacterium GWF2_43_11]HAQ64709.1 glycosyltransferase [Bacteroidales bacterium]HBZ67305.1 glycosyltransferase [Bacteroidales bacterium]
MKHVSIAVTNDLISDQRVDKVCNTLTKLGFYVSLTGRKLTSSPTLDSRPYHCHRMWLVNVKGPFFYAEFNIRLFIRLLFTKYDLLIANDLDTLPACRLVSILKRIPIVYDSHEFYTETPELISRPMIRAVWLRIEKMIFPHLKWVFTVNESIALAYEKRYGVKVRIVKNMPRFRPPADPITHREIGLPSELPIVLLQGAGINIERGAEELVSAMQYIDCAQLLIIGNGDVIEKLKSMREEMRLQSKVTIFPRTPYERLRQITATAIIGITIDKDTNPNYRFSLPNKLFDYIQAGTPVLASRLPEVEKVVAEYNVGGFIESHDPKHIADRITAMINDKAQLAIWKNNCLIAAETLNWEAQELELIKVYEQFI